MEDQIIVKDCNGNTLESGDTVIVTQDLKVKGGINLKRGTVIKKIRVTEDTDAIECKVDGSTLVLKTIYLKKKS